MSLKNPPNALAVELLLIVAARHHLWPLLPEEMRGVASKGLGAALVLVLLSMIYRLAPPSRLLSAVLCLAAFYSLQTFICTAWWLVDPWQIAEGVGMCSDRLGFDLGALGIIAVIAILSRMK